jgi:photosystem II stability/assembly factor-like uncharacterized protein
MNSKGNLFSTSYKSTQQQLFKSTDNGNTWSVHLDSITPSSFITFNERRGFCTNTNGVNTLISDDDGSSWYEDSLFDEHYCYDMRFKDGTGYCNGYTSFYETYDNGHTWILPFLFTGVINSIAPLSNKSCIVFAIGPLRDSVFHSSVLQTNDDRNWTGIEFKNIDPIYANSFYTTKNGYASAKNKLLKITIK